MCVLLADDASAMLLAGARVRGKKMHTQVMYSVYTVQFATYYSRKLDNVDEK